MTNLQSAPVDAGFVRHVLEQALRLQGYREPPDVGVALVDDGYIRVLNREYRGGDYATDVLAFPIDAGAGRPESSRPADRPSARPVGPAKTGGPVAAKGGAAEPTLGDIVISVERAREQARQFKHPLRREVALLAIHGLLHLLGYDDETEAAASVMWARQKELLATILGEGAQPSSPRGRRLRPREDLRSRPSRDAARNLRR